MVFLRIFKFKILLAGSTTESTCWGAPDYGCGKTFLGGQRGAAAGE